MLTKLLWVLTMKQLNCMSTIKRGLYLFLLVASLASCKSEYHQYVEREMASGETRDSLVFGMRIGQSQLDFYSICWDLNTEKIVRHSDDNQAVKYITDQDAEGNPTDRSKEMLFYGIFDQEHIMVGMDMSYSFVGWAPWNEEKHSGPLMEQLREEYEQYYPGNDFIDIELDGIEGPVMVKIDGNREILMYAKGDKDVAVRIEDLSHKLKDRWKKE